jgi:hypothetical protein
MSYATRGPKRPVGPKVRPNDQSEFALHASLTADMHSEVIQKAKAKQMKTKAKAKQKQSEGKAKAKRKQSEGKARECPRRSKMKAEDSLRQTS